MQFQIGIYKGGGNLRLGVGISHVLALWLRSLANCIIACGLYYCLKTGVPINVVSTIHTQV